MREVVGVLTSFEVDGIEELDEVVLARCPAGEVGESEVMDDRLDGVKLEDGPWYQRHVCGQRKGVGLDVACEEKSSEWLWEMWLDLEGKACQVQDRKRRRFPRRRPCTSTGARTGRTLPPRQSVSMSMWS